MTYQKAPFLLCVVLLCACTGIPATRSYILPEPQAHEQTSLEVRTANGLELSLITTNDGATTRTTLTASADYAPAWLVGNGGTLTTQTVDAHSDILADGCLQSAADLPPLHAAALLGPQPGFVAVTDGETTSSDGGQLWQTYIAHAEIRAGMVVSLDGQGTGRILLPDNTTRSDSYTWSYRRTPFLTTLPRITVRCAAQALESFALPFSATGRRMYGGALLAEHTDTPVTVSEAFTMLLRELGWTVRVLDASPDRITLDASRDQEAYHIVLSATATQTTELTVYSYEP
jgi:hypothetical protein